MANGALAGVVTDAAIKMPCAIRQYAVHPGLLEVSAAHHGTMFAGHIPVSSDLVGRGSAKRVHVAMSGRVLCVP